MTWPATSGKSLGLPGSFAGSRSSQFSLLRVIGAPAASPAVSEPVLCLCCGAVVFRLLAEDSSNDVAYSTGEASRETGENPLPTIRCCCCCCYCSITLAAPFRPRLRPCCHSAANRYGYRKRVGGAGRDETLAFVGLAPLDPASPASLPCQ